MTTKTESTGTTHLAWDFENLLTQVVTPSSGSVTYKYDALGRRVQTAPSTGASTNFTCDGDDVAQDKTSTNVITEYLNGPGIDNKIRSKSGNTLYYFAQEPSVYSLASRSHLPTHALINAPSKLSA